MDTEEAHMITAVVLFVIIAGCVTWYVTAH
jgi:hypothetical protein